MAKMGFSIGGLTGSNSSAKKAATVAFNRQKEILQKQHQWEMSDLEKAGLNPALTLGDIGGSSGGSVSPAQVNGGGDSVMGLINSAVSAYTAKKDAETGDTQGQLNLAYAEKAIAETKGIPQQLKNDTIRAIASQTQANAQSATASENIRRSKAGRFSEFGTMGIYVNDWITNSLKPQKYNSAKKQHWYGVRKDGK